jgi:hypothetical protein
MNHHWSTAALTLILLSPWPLLAAGQPHATPRAAPEEPSFAPAAPAEPPSRPAGPSPEICAKVREAQVRQERYEELSVSHSKLKALAAKETLLYTQMGYSPRQKEDRMADTYRGLEESRHRVQEAKAAYDRLADDLIGKVEKPWPACEAPK